MGDETEQESVRGRGEQAIGDLANALLDNPVFKQAVSSAFGAREMAIEAQQAAMGALNLPSAAEVERLERRLRSISERLEEVEEQIDQLGRDVGAVRRQLTGDAPRIDVGADQAHLQVEED